MLLLVKCYDNKMVKSPGFFFYRKAIMRRTYKKVIFSILFISRIWRNGKRNTNHHYQPTLQQTEQGFHKNQQTFQDNDGGHRQPTMTTWSDTDHLMVVPSGRWASVQQFVYLKYTCHIYYLPLDLIT